MIKRVIDKILGHLYSTVQGLLGYPSDVIDVIIDYDAYWKRRRANKSFVLGSSQQARLEKLQRIIKLYNLHPASVVDVGGADGAFVDELRKRVSIIQEVLCVDTSLYALEIAQAHGVKTLHLDLSNNKDVKALPKSDLLFALEVLEHLPNPEMLLKIMHEVANMGVVFSFPNTGHISYRVRLLFGRVPVQWAVHPGEHLRFWTWKDVKWWLSAQGFDNHTLLPHRGLPVMRTIWPSLWARDIFVVILKKNNYEH